GDDQARALTAECQVGAQHDHPLVTGAQANAVIAAEPVGPQILPVRSHLSGLDENRARHERVDLIAILRLQQQRAEVPEPLAIECAQRPAATNGWLQIEGYAVP